MNAEKEGAWHVTTTSVAWIALIASIIAIIISVVAYNRTDAKVDRVVRQEIGKYQAGVEDAAIRAKVKTELVALKARIGGAQAGDAIASDVSNARDNIMSTYGNASDGLKQESQDVSRSLQQVESDVRSNTAKGVRDLEELISKLGQGSRGQ